MERILLAEDNIEQVAARAASVLRTGGVVLYPTDTLYGLGADALSDEAVANIFAIKGRNEGKPMHAIVSNLDMAARYADVAGVARALTEKLPKGQITFVVPKRAEITSGISRDIATFGFRIPDNAFCIQMLQAFGRPITATSANKSGETPQRTVDAILAQLGDTAQNINLIVDAGELPARQSSSVVQVSDDGNIVVLRESAVSRAEIEALSAGTKHV